MRRLGPLAVPLAILVLSVLPTQTQAQQAPVQLLPTFGPTVYMNPLGFLQFGPTLGVEIPNGASAYFDLHVRMQGLGALMHALWDDTKIHQVGLGGGYRGFSGSPDSRNRYYAGGVVEFVWSPYGKNDYEGRGLGFVAAGQVGHRWRFASGIFLNLGVLAGSYIETSDESWNVNTPNQIIQGENESAAFGMLEFSIGKEFH